VLTFTGAFLGVAGITVSALAFVAYDGDTEKAISVINGPQAIAGAPSMQDPPDYVEMLREADKPGRSFALLIANNPEDSGQTTSVLYSEDGILSARSADIFRNDGEFLEKFGGKGGEVGARIFGAVQPLHYGTFGGYPIKLLYFVLALGLTYITSTGMMIWFKRKMQQGQPKAKTEAAWRGMTTGLTLALSAGAVIAVSGLAVPIPAVCLAVWAVGGLAIYLSKQPLMLVKAGWIVSAALLVCAVIVNASLASLGDTTSWLVNGIVILCALGLFAATLRLASRSAKQQPSLEAEPQPAE